MKYLGIDYGTKRIGVALSDEEGSFAFPKTIIPTEDAIGAIQDICVQEEVGGIVIGEPIATNNERNIIAGEVDSFCKKVATATKIPIHREQEGFSSVEAYRYQQTRGPADDSAAAIILQRFLDKLASNATHINNN